MYFIVGIICAALCGVIAGTKGRSVIGWVVLGFLFGIIPLIIVACLSNLNTQRAKEEHIAAENRRLREQLRQEQIKGETFRQHAAARLDAHDEQLKIDTRAMGPRLAGSSANQNQLGAGGAMLSEAPEGGLSWYYAYNGETLGPVSEGQLSQLIRNKTIDGTTLIWSEALTQWQPASQVQQFTLDFLGKV